MPWKSARYVRRTPVREAVFLHALLVGVTVSAHPGRAAPATTGRGARPRRGSGGSRCTRGRLAPCHRPPAPCRERWRRRPRPPRSGRWSRSPTHAGAGGREATRRGRRGSRCRWGPLARQQAVVHAVRQLGVLVEVALLAGVGEHGPEAGRVAERALGVRHLLHARVAVGAAHGSAVHGAGQHLAVHEQGPAGAVLEGHRELLVRMAGQARLGLFGGRLLRGRRHCGHQQHRHRPAESPVHQHHRRLRPCVQARPRSGWRE